MTIRAGIISDTHLSDSDQDFRRLADICFKDCEVIIHAGDLTSIRLLDAFSDKTVYAVHGNMCDMSCRTLPREITFQLGDFSIGLTHGAHLGRDIEGGLWNLFPEADCMIYGHTHQPVNHHRGSVLIVNPGTFRGTGRYGAPGTYAILEAGDELTCILREVPCP